MKFQLFRKQAARVYLCLYFLLAASTGVPGSGAALADPFPIEVAGWEIEPKLSATLALSPGRDDTQAREAESVTFDLRGELRADRVLENGVEIGARIAGRLQRDHPQRSGFSGQIGPIGPDPADLSPRGAFTGLTRGGAFESSSVRVQLETAFVYADGGYGEILLGRDDGIARRFYEGSPSVFGLHKIANPRLDTSGIATILTRNDLTGPSTKVSYASPRILGLRLGGSYTPRANVSGLDRDPDRGIAGVSEPQLTTGLEAAYNFSHRFRKSGVRVETYGAYARADVKTGPAALDFGTVEVWSTGGRFEWDKVEIGADWLTTDNGGGRYRAWSIGAKTQLFDTDVSGVFGRSFDDLTGIDGQGWSVGLSRTIQKNLFITAGLQQQRLRGAGIIDGRSTGPVFEMTLRY